MSGSTLRRRRLSTPHPTLDFKPPARLQTCQPLPHSLHALDLSTASQTQSLASLRFLVLEYLADLERRLSQLESLKEHKLDEARQWASEATDMLHSIRNDVSSHLPDFHGMDVESFVKSHLPSSSDFDFKLPGLHPLHYLPKLSLHLQSLHSHLSSFPNIHILDSLNRLSTDLFSLSSTLLSFSADLSDMVAVLLLTPADSSSPDWLSEAVGAVSDAVTEGEDMLERAALEVKQAIQRSLQGMQLITYSDLPPQWRNNPFVKQGYRFIPIERWPLIIMSLFAFHNETLNIHTHLIPFILYTIRTIPSPLSLLPHLSSYYFLSNWLSPTHPTPTPELLFTAFALLCFLASAIWHTMAGCAHSPSMEFCARVDYVGIGWLISASVGTVVYYGYGPCHPTLCSVFLGGCAMMGLAGNIAPFLEWFNSYEWRAWRITFFVALALSSVAPLAGLALLHSFWGMIVFISPIFPSLASYIIGLVFYVTHIPERWLPETWCRVLDRIGGGSHCIWHCFIVLAVSQHKAAMRVMKDGMACPTAN